MVIAQPIREERSHPLRRTLANRWLPWLMAIVGVTGSTSLEAAVNKRRLPDYDGRGGEPKKPGYAALWVPRSLFFPFYLVSEYVVRRPLGALVSAAERARLPQALYGFFMLSDDHKVGWVPTFFVDFGFKPSIGVYFFWNDAVVKDNDVSVHAATWGKDWLLGSISDRWQSSVNEAWTFRASALRRPDFRYYGEGPSTTENQLSRYGATRIEASVTYSRNFGEMSQLQLGTGYRSLVFHQPDEGMLSVSTAVEQGRFAAPAALDSGYRAGFSRVLLRLDSRKKRPHPQTGVRLDLDAEQGSAPDTPARGWLRYGAIAGGFLDLDRHARVLSLSMAAQMAEPLASGAVPFTELVQLGGAELMRGFLPGRLFGRSALVSTLSYRWPVWIWLDGTIQLSVGNVYGPQFSDFSPSQLRFSGAMGVQTSVRSENPVEILLGFGTETFERGAQINTLRLAFGTTRGF